MTMSGLLERAYMDIRLHISGVVQIAPIVVQLQFLHFGMIRNNRFNSLQQVRVTDMISQVISNCKIENV